MTARAVLETIRGSIPDTAIFPAVRLRPAPAGGSWAFASLVGILAEISEEAPSGALSFVAEVIAEAQRRGEPVAWVAGSDSIFFPPDLSRRGVDLAALAVIRAGGQDDSLVATEWLARSAALGLVIVDCEGSWNVNDAALGRIQKLAERGQCAVVFLTRKLASDPSLGSRIALRGCISRCGADPFLIELRTAKDKRSNSSSPQRRQYHGPPGMH